MAPLVERSQTDEDPPASGAESSLASRLRNVTDPTPNVSDESLVLAEIGRIITSSPSIDDVYARLAEIVKPLISFDRIDIVSIDKERNSVCAEFVHGLDLAGVYTQRGHTIPLAGSIAEQVRPALRGSVRLFGRH